MIHKIRCKNGKLSLVMNNQMHSNYYRNSNDFVNIIHLTLIYCPTLFCKLIWINQLKSDHGPIGSRCSSYYQYSIKQDNTHGWRRHSSFLNDTLRKELWQ